MESVLRGERRALGSLYNHHSAPLFNFLVRWTGEPAAAEDLMHDTFLRLLAPGVRYDGRGRFRTWLFRIARNLATDRFRRERVQVDIAEVEPLSNAGTTALEALTDLEDHGRLERALGRIDERHREVLMLRTELDLSHRELGNELGCAEGAARVRLHRALAALRHAWNEEGAADE